MTTVQKVEKSITAVVVSDKPEKSVTVKMRRLMKHPLYKKYVYKSSTLAVHDPKNEASEGDTIEIIKCRPMSKTKKWRFKSIKIKAGVASD